jgi:hypothetical protein
MLLNTLYLNFSIHMISILQTKSCDNLADLFSKFLSYCTFSNVLLLLVCVDLEIYMIYGEFYHKVI